MFWRSVFLILKEEKRVNSFLMKQLIERNNSNSKKGLKFFSSVFYLTLITAACILFYFHFLLFIKIVLGSIVGFILLAVFYEYVLKIVLLGQILLPLSIILIVAGLADQGGYPSFHYWKFILFFLWLGFWIWKGKRMQNNTK